MGLKDFRIIYDNHWNTYYPGQTVSGNIIVVLDSTKKIRGMLYSKSHLYPMNHIMLFLVNNT